MNINLQKAFGVSVFSLLLGIFSGCNHTIDDIEIVREPSLAVEVNGTAWQTDRPTVTGFGQELVYETDSSTEGVLRFGYSMVMNGRTEKGLNRKITIRFALPRQDELRGTYTAQPSERGTITRVEVLEQLSAQQYTVYRLVPSDSTTFLRIDRQSTDKRLIAGSFAFKVVNTHDVTQTITGTNGVFTDISYQKWQNSNL